MSEKNRPTSPHLQIYRWNIPMFSSIAHRLTGVLLYFSILVISWYITYYAYRLGIADQTAEVMEHCDCPGTQILHMACAAAATFVTFALFYHFLNGIRHLCWDFGKGFEVKTAKRTGVVVVALAIVLTILTIFLVTQNFVSSETVEIIIQ